MDLGDFAKFAMLEFDCVKSINVEDYSFQYLKADKKVRDIKNPFISEYYLIALDDRNVELISSLEGFYKLQKNLLADTFFNIKNDVRWNLYLIFLFEELSVLKNVPTWDIENDDNYARKYFFDYSYGLNFFQKDRYFTNEVNNNNLPSNPLNDWIDILTPLELTGILTEKNYKSNINNYLNGESLLSPEIMTNNQTDLSMRETSKVKKQIIESIKQISLGSFRDHCFRKDTRLNPALINLIHGSNGSGKTSILEAVELALTGEIKRLKDFKETIKDPPLVTIDAVTKNGICPFKSNITTAAIKELDRTWYGTPIGREKSTLNSNFNHFNSFNSETSYKFALEESAGENDYSERFSRLIYDEDILSMEKLLKKHKDYLSEELDKREKLLIDKKQQIEELQNEIKGSTINNDLDIMDLLKVIKFKISDNNVNNYEEIYSLLKVLRPIISSLKTDWAKDKYKSIAHLNSQIMITQENINLIQKDLSAAESAINNIEEKNKQILHQIKENKLIKNHKEENMKTYELSLMKWKEYKNILSNESHVLEYNSLLFKEKDLTAKKDYLTFLKKKYPDVWQFSFDDINTVSNNVLDEIITELKSKEEEYGFLESRIEEINGHVEEVKRLKMQINNIGLELIELNEEKNVCPLCGTIHQDQTKLMNVINQISGFNSKNEKDLSELVKRKEVLFKAINNITKILSEDDRKNRNLKLLKSIATEINNAGYYFVNLNYEGADLLKEILYVGSILDDLDDESIQLSTSIKAFENQGFSSEKILASKMFIEDDILYQEYLLNNRQETFEQYISFRKQSILSELDKLSIEIEVLNKTISNNDMKTEVIEIDNLKLKLDAQKQKLDTLNRLRAEWDKLCSYFQLSEEDDILDWLMIIDQTYLKIEVVITHLQMVKGTEEKNKNLRIMINEFNHLKEQIDRGKFAVSRLDQVKTLNEYSIKFIETNIKRIEYFFKCLHTPREFGSLGVDLDGIFTVREKDEALIRMHQMSTGQRVALAIAIMFSLHIAAPRAPRFLLLDEPIANLDDLHLLNFIDILREFALRNTQIICTTANPEVAGIFRRKFSFFENDYKHYELIRKNDDSTEIITYEYNPYSEEPKIYSVS